MATAAEQLFERGYQEGLQEGRRDVLRKALLVLLEARFGAPSDEVVARVNGADLAQLEWWFHRAITAPTLADALNDP